MKCTFCGTAMKVLFQVTWYCPNDCDKKENPKEFFHTVIHNNIEYRADVAVFPELPPAWATDYHLFGESDLDSIDIINHAVNAWSIKYALGFPTPLKDWIRLPFDKGSVVVFFGPK